MEQHSSPGPVALVGSGEFLPIMEETDRSLLEHVGGPGQARVVVLPTASGLEGHHSSAHWARMGLDHFSRLGAQVQVAAILNREDAADPAWLALLEAGSFFYYSGGNPHHLIESMAGSPAWEVILRRHQEGAVLAGCSAGAMAICGLTANIRALRGGSPLNWSPALGVLPGLIVMPHFDQVANFAGEQILAQLVRAVPAGMALIGVDEETALVRMAGPRSAVRTWQVLGRQTVSIFMAGGVRPAVYQAGETALLTTA